MKNNEDETELNEKKVCSKCKENKELGEFAISKSSKTGYQSYCKICKIEWYNLNKDEISKNANKKYKKFREANPVVKKDIEKIKNRIKEYHKQYEQTNKGKIKIYKQQRQPIRNEYDRNNRKTKPLFKLAETIRVNINRYIKKGKSKSSKNILGCTWEELKIWIESKWLEGMSWDNHTVNGWHIDHVIPLASAKTEEEIYKLNHYTNLQPLWWYDNLSKGKKYENN